MIKLNNNSPTNRKHPTTSCTQQQAENAATSQKSNKVQNSKLAKRTYIRKAQEADW